MLNDLERNIEMSYGRNQMETLHLNEVKTIRTVLLSPQDEKPNNEQTEIPDFSSTDCTAPFQIRHN